MAMKGTVNGQGGLMVRWLAMLTISAALFLGATGGATGAETIRIGDSDWVVTLPKGFRAMTEHEQSTFAPVMPLVDTGFFTRDDALRVTLTFGAMPLRPGATVALNEAAPTVFFDLMVEAAIATGLDPPGLIESGLVEIGGDLWAQLEIALPRPSGTAKAVFLFHPINGAILIIQSSAPEALWPALRPELLGALASMRRQPIR